MSVHTRREPGKSRRWRTRPASAITYNSCGASVFVVAWPKRGGGKIVHQVFVTTGPTRGAHVAVLSGLKPGETVVTSGQLKLSPGAAVKIDNSVQPPDAANPKPVEQ